MPISHKGIAAGFLFTGICLAVFILLAAGPVSAQDQNRGVVPLFSPEEQAYIRAKPIIRVSNEFDWPPFDFTVSGLPAGFGIDLMDLLAQKSGLEFTYVNGHTWDELLRRFFKGDIQVIHSLSLTPERQQKALFSAPYYHSKNVIVFRTDTQDIHTLNDLEGRIISLPRGWSSVEFFKTYFPKVHIIEVENSRQALEYLDQGKVAATVEQEGIARYFIAKYGFTDMTLSKWIDHDELQKTASMHFAVLKTNPLLFSILDKALAAVSPGEMDRLKEKWFSRAGRLIGAEDAGLTPEEQQWLKNKKTVVYCIARNQLPYSDINGSQTAGMAADFMDLVAERTGTGFSILATADFSQSMDQLKQGSCDILPLASKTADRQKYMDFTVSFADYNVAIIAREDTPFISDIPALAPRRTGLVTSSNIYGKVVAAFPKLRFVPVDSVTACLRQVSAGQLDAAVLSLPMASHYIRAKGFSNLKVAGHTSIREDLRMAVRKGDQPLDTIIAKISRSVTHQEFNAITDKWMSLDMKPPVNYTLLGQILGGAVLLVAIVVFWNRNLARLNREIALANQQLQDKTRELEQISVTDSLTGLHNRRYAEQAFELEVRRTIRHHHDLSLLLLDVDFFKAINDTYGHQTGDAVLITVARLLKTNVRSTDILGRWGGEEFIIVCPEIGIENAVLMARGLCKKFSQARFDPTGTQTASFGVTAFKPGDDVNSLMLRADKALYRAKANGRNRVEYLI